MKPLIFAFDLATLTGFACGRTDAKPAFGTWRLKDTEDDPDRAFGNLSCKLRDAIDFYGVPDFVVYEAPILPGALRQEPVSFDANGVVASVKKTRHTNAKTTYLLVGLAAIAAGVPRCWNVVPKRVHVAKARKSFLGIGYPENPKIAVMRQCRLLGFDVKDDNAADALALWHHEAGLQHGQSLLDRVAS